MSHYFNMINDQIYDFTKDQFGNSKIEYLNIEIKSRDTILRNKNTRERYQILREHLSQELLELDEINKEIALYPSYSSDIEKF